jgi:TorA maturation chaperone TorD
LTSKDERITKENVKALLEARSYAYDVLRSTFLEEPTKDFLRVLKEKDVLNNFPFIQEDDILREGIEEAVRDLKEDNLSEEEKIDSLRWDYTRMFIGPAKLIAPPWQTAYLTEERLLFQEETLEVRRRYLAYNFLPPNYPHEADDHIGYMLDFLYQLTLLALESLAKDDREELRKILSDQKDFIQTHMLNWVPLFAKDIIENAENGFYKGMAKVLTAWLKLDHEAIDELLEAV